MTKTFGLVLLSFLATPAFAKSGTAKSYECVANHNMFVADKCVRTSQKDVSCQMEIYASGAQQIFASVSLSGVLSGDGPVSNAFQVNYTKGGSLSRHNVKFSHLNRGMILLVNNKKEEIKGILGLEVYLNKDSSGSRYTKYVCGTIK